jgi:DNA repair photolyase
VSHVITDKQPLGNKDLPIVLSASRRTDLISCYPEHLIEKLKEYPPEKVHTIVVWTKNPVNMVTSGPLRDLLSSYRQLYIHLTITGLGRSILEPRIPEWEKVVDMIPGILELAGDPKSISWRFDPIVRAKADGKKISNFNLFPVIAEKVKKCGISTCRTSWVEPYRKVIRRMDKKGVRLITHSPEERLKQAEQLEQVAGKIGIKIHYCSMDGLPRSRCIDGRLLSELHPDGMSCSLRKAKGQRRFCGCTESLDIGWYSLKCRNGCLYCYAEPLSE